MSKLDLISGGYIRKPSVTIPDSDVDEVLMTLRKQRRQWKHVKRPARLEDRITITYSLTSHEEIIERLEPTSCCVVLGSGDFHKDLEQRSLIGVRGGESITAEAQLPHNYANADLAGKRAVFTISVNEVCKPVLPELDIRFAKEFGLSKGGAETLHREVRSIMQRKVDSMIKQIVRTQIIDILLAKYPLKIDERDIQHEIIKRQQTKKHAPQLVHPDSEFLEPTEEQLRALVKLNAIMKDIIRTKQLVIDTKRLNITVTAMAQRADRPDKAEKKYYENFEELSKIEAEMLEDQVVECMLEHLNVESVSMSYKGFMSAVNSSWQVSELSNWPIIQLRTDNKCDFCSPSKCCQYITQKIPSPRSKKDFRHLLWQVSHEKTKVFKDSDGWHLLFETPCANLQADGRCGIYEGRPPICCDYSVKQCEFDGSAEEGWELSFEDYESLLKYCTSRFRRWDLL